MSKSIDVQNIGPVRRVSIPVPEQGGVVVLYGANGSGKSETLTAVDKMLGREAHVATPTDGHDRGKIEGLGVTLTVGRTTRRTGELEVVALDSKLSVADIVDPGIKDPAAADEKRMKAILSVLQVRPALDDWLPLAQDNDALLVAVKSEFNRAPDVLTLAARLKAKLSLKAVTVEADLAREEGYVGKLTADPRVAAQEAPETPPSNDVLAANLTAAQQTLGKLEARRDAAKQAAAYQAELDGLLAEAGDVEAMETETKSMADRLSALRAEADALTTELATKSRDLTAAKANRARIEQLKGRLAAATPPDPAELVAATLDVDAARQAFVDAETTRGVIQSRQHAAEASARAVGLKEQAIAMRAAAKQPEAILAGLMQSRVPGLRYEDGRMIYRHAKRGDMPFAEMSFGERCRVAMGILVAGIGRGGLATIAQEAWEGLDPMNRDEVDELAREHGVVILTAEASDAEEIEATVYEPASQID